MPWERVNLTEDDPTSTAASMEKIKEMARQVRQTQPVYTQNQQAFAPQQVHNNLRKHEAKRVVETAVEDNDRAIRLNGRDYKSMQETLTDAIHHIEKESFRREDYAFRIHPETFNLIRDLYDFYARSPTSRGDCYQFMGTSMVQGKDVPKGWAVLAKGDDLEPYELRTNPFVLIEEIDAGYREVIEIEAGGEMEFRVIQA